MGTLKKRLENVEVRMGRNCETCRYRIQNGMTAGERLTRIRELELKDLAAMEAGDFEGFMAAIQTARGNHGH